MRSASATTPKFCPSCRARFGTDALFCPNDGTPLLAAPSDFPHNVAEAAPDPYLGREISGHIEIRQLAGVGAMGRVYRAFQSGIDRDVAVKILHRELSANPQLVSRFHREAKVASRLQHPNVVHVHLAGQLPDGALYIVMEYLDGMSLQSALAAAGGAMPLVRAMHVAFQLCDAVGEAHAQGVVHRDLKPENVMLVRRGQDDDYVKVLDFGIARLSWGEQSMATAAGLIFGTARYISPEGAQGESVGPPGDVYAIATLTYQMLAGRTPFEGDQAVGLLIQQIHDPPPPLRSIPRASYVPEPIAACIMKSLAKDRAAREPDARAFGRALLEAARVAGLAPEEIVGRGMFGPSSQQSIRLPPIQATSKLELSPELREQLGHVGSGGANGGAAAKRREGASSDMLLGVPLPSAPTTKWTPPTDLLPAPAPGVGPRAPDAAPSGVETTIDDDDVPPVPPARLPRTEIATRAETPAPTPAPVAAAGAAHAPTPAPIAASNPAPFPAQAPMPALVHTAPLAPRPAPTPTPAPAPGEGRPFFPTPAAGPARAYAPSPAPLRTPAPTPVPPASERDPLSGRVDTTLDDESGRPWARYTAMFLLLFLLGSAGAATIAYKLGYFARSAPVAREDELAARAERALGDGRWDAPPGDNVRDLTSEGLARWPNDPRLTKVRTDASKELAKRALAAKTGGDLHEAAHLARVASELDPTNAALRDTSLDYERELSHLPDAAALQFLTDAGALSAPTHGASQVAGPRATLDAKPAKPKLGQPVEFTARVVSARGGTPATVSDAHFSLLGPGLGAGANLAALNEGGATPFTAGFTFLESGRFEVSFVARVDGTVVKTTRVVVVEPARPQPPAGGDTSAPPAPTGSVKWL